MEDSPVKNKYFCFVVLILILSLTGVGYGVYLLVSKGDNDGGQVGSSLTCAAEAPDNVKMTILNDYAGDAPWWNDDFSYFKQIGIQNTHDSETLSKECIVTLQFAHSLFVEDKRSRANGGDLRILYYDGKEYKNLPMKVIDPNTSKTRVQFNPVADIEPEGTDSDYYLYYGNVSAKTKDDLDTSDKLYAHTTNININKIVYPDISGELSRHWILKGMNDDAYSKFSYKIRVDDSITVDKPPTYELIGSGMKGELEYMSKGLYYKEFDTSRLTLGSYQLQTTLISEGKTLQSTKSHIFISYPLFVTWTMDWEGYDVPDNELQNLADFSDKHDLPVTHFFNPSIYVSPEISSDRATYLTNWIKEREKAGDEIGMHLHMHLYMVEAAGVKPRTSPKWTNYLNTGHDVPMTAYTKSEVKQILKWATDKFLEEGLPSPIAFRAGGWFANIETLEALQENGFIIDSSGRDKYTWGSLEGPWNLHVTSSPYKPSKADQNSTTPPTLDIWEFPNNGSDSWFHDSNELISRFNQNFNNESVQRVQVLTYLTHPHQISRDIEQLEPTFNYIDQFMAVDDQGPVFYITQDEALKYL
jgi:predicted deacetylase